VAPVYVQIGWIHNSNSVGSVVNVIITFRGDFDRFAKNIVDFLEILIFIALFMHEF
jgi:hypothetical protein